MRDLVLAWLRIPGPDDSRSWTAREIIELIEEKWSSGDGVSEEDVLRTRQTLDELVEEGLVESVLEPRFRIKNPP